MLSTPFLFALCLFYFTGILCARTYLKFFSFSALKAMRWTLGLGLLLHLSILFSIFYQQRRFFPTNPYESHLLLTAVLAMSGFFITFRRSWIFLVLILFPLIIAVLTFFGFYNAPEVEAPLPTPWLWIHIFLMLVGEAFFFLSASVSILYLMADRQLRARKLSGIVSMLPSLAALDTLLSETLWAGFVLLSSGMFIGFIFAKQFWEVGWLLDPKVLACVLTWALYALLLFFRSVKPNFRGRRSALVACIGFLVVLFLAWGVERLFPTQHLNFKSSSEAL